MLVSNIDVMIAFESEREFVATLTLPNYPTSTKAEASASEE